MKGIKLIVNIVLVEVHIKTNPQMMIDVGADTNETLNILIDAVTKMEE